MPTTSSSVLFAASLCAVVAAQSPASPTVPAPDRTADLGGGSASPLTLPQEQEPDYSLYGLFQQAHGDFMLERERFDPMIELRASSLTNSGVDGNTGEFDEYFLAADIEVPVMVSTDAYLKFGMFYESRHFSAANMTGFADETIYAGGGKFGFGWFVGADVLIEGMAQPGSWSDWDGTPHHKDFDFPAGMLATVRYSEELFWKVGARYNEIYENANVLPYVGFSWVAETVRVDLLAPEMLEVSLWPSPDVGILFGAEVQGAEYRVRTSQALGNQEGDLRVQEVLLYTGMQWRMNDYTSLGFRAGAAVAGDYKLEDGNAGTARIAGTLDPALFLEVSFGIDF